jgi:DNA-binding transcriptional ArsR family regulator
MDLCREILRRLEALPDPDNFDPIEIDGQPPETVSYHIRLLWEAGFIDAHDVRTMGDYDYRAKCLTWQGHEFLEASRDDGLWKKAKDTALSKGGGLTLDVLKAVLVELAKRAALGAIT